MSWIPAAITGFLGYQGAKDQAAQQAANNALLKEQYEYEKSVRAPAVTGAQNQLSAGRWVDAEGKPVAEGTAGARWQSQFQPFVDASANQAIGASNIAGQYLSNVPLYQQAGLAGLAGYQDAAKYSDPALQDKLASDYARRYGMGIFDIAARGINRQADDANRRSSTAGGRFGALSSQRARQAGEIDRTRTEALLDAATKARDTGYQRAQAELQRRQGLAGALTSLGTSGLSQAASAASLGSTAQQQGIDAPFRPFNAYSAAVGAAPKVNPVEYKPVADPFATGVGLGLEAWNTFRK